MSSTPTIKRQLDLSNPRYFHHSAKWAVRDVFDALTELVTNADDAYVRSRMSGRIEIEVERRRKGASSVVQVRDFASGLTQDEMDRKLSHLGERRDSGLPMGEMVRGTNSRGAKDVAALGPVVFESISGNGEYARCQITPQGEFEMWAATAATAAVRKQLGIRQGTGTLVTIEVDSSYKIPHHDNLCKQLQRYVPLRDILADPQREVYVRDMTQSREDQLRWYPPEGVERVNETISIPGYEGATAKLTIKRAKKPLENKMKFREGGIVIKSRRAVHEATLFAPEFERDPHAAMFFGWLRCEYIDDLWNEYDDRQERDLSSDAQNPFPILDPSRQAGLRRDHPFFVGLQREVLKRLRLLVEEERKKEAAQRAHIESRETRRRLNELEKLATRFMQEELTESEEDLDNRLGADLPQGTRDVRLSPPFAQMIVKEKRCFSLTVNQSVHADLAVGSMVQIQCETREISTDKVSCPLEPHPNTNGLLRAVWEVKADQTTKATGLVVRVGSVVANAVIEVFESERDLYADIQDLQFRRKRYRLRPGQAKRIRLVGPHPGLVEGPTPVTFTCPSRAIQIVGDRVLHPRQNLGIVECSVRAVCNQADVTAVLSASVNGSHAEVELVCGPPQGDAIKIELDDVDYTNQRYRWERGTNKLIIAARHPSIQRYLGAKNRGFPGQEKIQFKVLLAEIVAFAVAEKVLERRVVQEPEDFRNADLPLFLAERDKLVTKFLPSAHESQVANPL